MPGTVFLEGEKVNLRTVEEEDIEFLRDGVNHPDVRVHMGNRTPQNLENEEEFFEDQVCGDDTLDLLICKDNEATGIITLMLNETERVAEIGIWLHPDYHGNGYGTEASEILIDHAFYQLNYHKIWAYVHADDEPSQNIWKKLGFQKEGKLRKHTYTEGEYKDVIPFGLLKGEWE
jgi:RimJ/RimL family protein N-acetyltransferase